LAIDDRREIRFLVQRFLEEAGAEVATVENGLIAQQAVARSQDAHTPIDLILIDIQMPEMDGLEATRRIRQMGYRGPIVALSANISPTDIENCRQAGCDDWLGKPIDQSDLLHKIAKWLHRPVAAT
jgi:CheY-like chemotaxis protein